MGWLIAGFVVAITGITVGAIQRDQQISAQQEANRIAEDQLELERRQALIAKKDAEVNYRNNYNDALSQLLSYDEAIRQSEIDLLDLGSKKSGYETLLERWQGNYDTQMSTTEADAYTTYKDLIANWTGTEVINASKGKSGTTALALENQSNKELRMYLGDDMRLNTREEMSSEGFNFDANGGILGKLWREQHLDLLSDKSSYQQNIDILTDSIGKTQESIDTSLAGMSDALSNAEGLIGSINDIRSDIKKSDPNATFKEIDTKTLDKLKNNYKDKI